MSFSEECYGNIPDVLSVGFRNDTPRSGGGRLAPPNRGRCPGIRPLFLNLCLLHDVTGQVRAEEDLRLLNATLEERVVREVEENREKERILARQARFAALLGYWSDPNRG